MTLRVFALLVLASTQGVPTLCNVAGECARPKPVYKVMKLSTSEVGISCLNGGDPTGKKIGNVLIISCGQ